MPPFWIQILAGIYIPLSAAAALLTGFGAKRAIARSSVTC